MNPIEIKELLENYKQRLEEARILNMQSWVLNQKCFEDLQIQKSTMRIRSLITIKTLMVILGIIWVIFLSYLWRLTFPLENLFFLISIGAIIVFNLLAIGVYFYHLSLINKLNVANTVVQTQEMIAKLKISTLIITRILILQTPFYCTFWWNVNMIRESPLSFWFISVPIALIFIISSLLLFKNINIKNRNKKWFKLLFNSPEWRRLDEAEMMLEDIYTYQVS